jgi:hypothetical protein
MDMQNQAGKRGREQTAALIEGLHSLAQPLTSVQGALELAVLEAESVDDYKQSIEDALAELARVGTRFNLVRQLVGSIAALQLDTSHEMRAKGITELS